MHLKSRGYLYAILSLSAVLIVPYAIQAQQSVSSGQPATVTILDSGKEQDGLVGSVRRVKTESAKIEVQAGQLKEGPLKLLEVTTYDLKGKRVENVTYPILSTTVGKEEYRYDPKGNIIEMTLRADDGSILSREAYDYEFDRFGNWKKMITNLVVFEGAELKREPVEVTYRTFTYYFDDAVASALGSRPSPPTIRTNPPLPHSRVLGSYSVATDPLVGGRFPSERLSIDLNEAPPEPPVIRVEQPVRPEPAITMGHRESIAKTERAEPVVKTESKESTGTRARTVAADTALVRTPAPEPPKTNSTTPALNASSTTAPLNAATVTKAAYDLYNEGQASFASGDLKGAVSSFLKSLELEPKSAVVNLGLGHAYLKLKNSEEAGKAFKRAVELNPELAEAHYGLGLNYYNRKRYRDAEQSFKRVLTIQPGMAKAHFGLALAYQQLDDQVGLMKEYRTLENIDPALAKRLYATFPQFILPCRAAPFCK
jgi:Flp pilus assembly protein TadD